MFKSETAYVGNPASQHNLLIRMKYLRQITLILALMFGVAVPGHATVLVSNVWNTGDRTYPAYNDPNSPYSEMGFDYNSSGDLESAWFQGGSGTLVPVGAGGPLRGSGYGGNSATWTTYFTPVSSPVTLSGAGDQIKITWIFTPTTITANTSQGLPVCLVATPSGSRLTVDGSPVSTNYTGYAVYMNMAPTLANSHSFQLMTRNAGSAALLSSSGAWTGVADGATKNNHGYDSGTQYTFVMTVTRNVADGLDIVATMTGGTLNGTGTNKASYTDTTPNGGSYTFDTFAIRPSKDVSSASQFDTSLFKMEFIPGATPPAIEIDTQDQTAFVGQDATFNVVASGTSPLSYQWYYNTNTILTNATSSTLTLTNVQLADSGGYTVVVTNSYGSVTSAVAQLTVNVPVAPSITTQPQDQTSILPGATATFSVAASGSDPLNYQWYYNTNTLLANATDSILTITNVQPGNAGSYSVTVSNLAGGVISSNAFLTVNTNPVAPVFISQPASLVVVTGSTVSVTAAAAGTAPIGYQWNRNGTPIPGATASTLTLTNVQTANSGTYTLTASNSVGSVTSNPAQLTVTTTAPIVNSAYNLVGFGQATTGGGVIAETNSAYRKVTNALDLANAVLSAYKTAGSVKVIEIMTNLDLGWNEVGSAVRNLGSTPFRAHTTPKLHPRLITTGVSLIDIKPKSGLTIFSANGSTIRHACFNVKSTANIIIRNLKFDEMWEWDEASKGNYDGNDWDFIDLGNGGTVSNIWIDHCTFTKAYDGIVDIKGGSFNITFSWCKYTGDDGATNTNSFVWQQINSLESNKTAYAMYNSLRTSSGFSTTDIVTIIQGHDKTHLVGANDGVKNAANAAENAQHSLTFHHQWFQNCWDRCVPRLRAGSVHDFNIYADDTLALAAKRLRDQHTVSSSYSFNPFLNGSISTESGAILLEKSVYIDCLTPLRNNQTDPSDPRYTGKIKALDTIYQMDSTVVRGNSTDPGNPLGPFQATVIPFSWNTNSATPNGQLPYTYTLDDPSQLQAIITSPAAGAGAGVLTWNKTNWLITAYPPSAPTIIADPQGQTYTAGQYAAFTVAAGGSAPFRYQWYFNTNSGIPNATNTLLEFANVQVTNTGTYSVIVSNTAGSATSSYAPLVVTAANTPPTLSPVPDTNIIAGVTLNITNVVTDPDLPSQTLTFSLLSGPNNAVLTQINNTNATFNWRPLISQAGTTNPITVKVADNGAPILSATQSFNVIVRAPVQPQIPVFGFNDGQFSLTITGDTGPDYIVLASTNLTDWDGIFTNHSPPPPFVWSDSGASNFSQRFYRIQLGP
jgi:pectate lyase